MAQMERPVPADRMAVLETGELPGRASMMDWAFFEGSSVGVEEAWRVERREVVLGRARGMREGRSARPAPGLVN